MAASGHLNDSSSPLRRAAKTGLLLALVALAPAAVSALWHPRAPAWTAPAAGDGTISWAEAHALPNPLWIDARSPEEFARGHVPTALSLPPAEWETRLEAVLIEWSPERPVVVYCGGNGCLASHAVARRLRDELGFTRVHVLADGWKGEERPAP